MFLSTILGLLVVGLGFYLIQREMLVRRKLADALQDTDIKKNNFLAVVGHELRNPLAAITNAADVLHLLGNLDEPGEETLAIINRQIVFMTRLVNDLLDTTRIAHGKLSIRKGRIDLVELLRRVITDARSALQGSGVSIESELPTDPVWVFGDATRLVQVIGNLLDNAVKFSPRDGRVWVRLRSGEGDGAQATIAVVDQGIGMEAESLKTIFEPFVQGGAARDSDRRGLGLGLALARGLVELHGGQLTARSEGLGRGTTMTIVLPLDQTTAEEGESCSNNSPHVGRCRVVVIDDRRDACYMLKRILELSGHEVHVATDGPQGIELACAIKPDLVLCDIGLAGELNGYDVVRKLRKLPETENAHVVAVTGYGQDEVRQRATEAGFHRHLVKPVSIAELNQIIVELPCSTANHKQTADSAE
jgi:CheY-like chemotaxis protein